MRITYIRPEAVELQLGYLLALAASPSEADGNLESFDNSFVDINW